MRNILFTAVFYRHNVGHLQMHYFCGKTGSSSGSNLPGEPKFYAFIQRLYLRFHDKQNLIDFYSAEVTEYLAWPPSHFWEWFYYNFAAGSFHTQ